MPRNSGIVFCSWYVSGGAIERRTSSHAAGCLVPHNSLRHADWYQTCTRPRSVSEPVSVSVPAGGRSPVARPQSGRSAAGSSGRPARLCPLRTGEPSQRLRVHRVWKHQADVLRLWPQRNREERWDRHEMRKVSSEFFKCVIYLFSLFYLWFIWQITVLLIWPAACWLTLQGFTVACFKVIFKLLATETCYIKLNYMC